MANYLRDRHIANVTVTKDAVEELVQLFDSTAAHMNRALQPGDTPVVFRYFVIRHDEQGDRVFDVRELVDKYQRAKKVERLIFTLESPESLRSGRAVGTYAEATFDPNNPNCFVTVSSDDQTFVNDFFAKFEAVIERISNWHGRVRNSATELVIQLVGVGLCFTVSVVAAARLGNLLTVENSILLSFLFVFLLLANLWGYTQKRVFAWIASSFPSIEFNRGGKKYIHWLLQAVIGAGLLYVLGMVFDKITPWLADLLTGVFALK